MKSILVLDPGESTGWCYQDEEGKLHGGTCGKDHTEVMGLLLKYQPEHVVFERFNLYPGKAKQLAWNTFYPCEVIGVIRFFCMHRNVPYTELAPSVKKYAGGFREDWEALKLRSTNITEHSKDAYLLYKYFMRNCFKKVE